MATTLLLTWWNSSMMRMKLRSILMHSEMNRQQMKLRSSVNVFPMSYFVALIAASKDKALPWIWGIWKKLFYFFFYLQRRSLGTSILRWLRDGKDRITWLETRVFIKVLGKHRHSFHLCNSCQFWRISLTNMLLRFMIDKIGKFLIYGLNSTNVTVLLSQFRKHSEFLLWYVPIVPKEIRTSGGDRLFLTGHKGQNRRQGFTRDQKQNSNLDCRFQ